AAVISSGRHGIPLGLGAALSRHPPNRRRGPDRHRRHLRPAAAAHLRPHPVVLAGPGRQRLTGGPAPPNSLILLTRPKAVLHFATDAALLPPVFGELARLLQPRSASTGF